MLNLAGHVYRDCWNQLPLPYESPAMHIDRAFLLSLVREVNVVDWNQLTRVPAKVAAYKDEIYFRETWEELSLPLVEVPNLLHETVTVVFKPDSVVGRRIGPILDYLGQHGFNPIAIQKFVFTRHMTREIWRQQGNAATLDRFRLIDEMLDTTPCLMVLFRNRRATSETPATPILRNLKGNGFRDHKPPSGLRAAAHSPLPLLSLIHAPDEPIDLIRELGILLDSATRRALLTDAVGAWDADASRLVHTAVTRLYAEHPAVDLDPEAARLRALKALRNATGGNSHSERLIEAMESSRNPELTWHELVAAFAALDSGLSRWDLIMVGSMVLPLNLPGVAPRIASDSADTWGA